MSFKTAQYSLLLIIAAGFRENNKSAGLFWLLAIGYLDCLSKFVKSDRAECYILMIVKGWSKRRDVFLIADNSILYFLEANLLRKMEHLAKD